MTLDFENRETIKSSVLNALEMSEYELNCFWDRFEADVNQNHFREYLSINRLVKKRIDKVSWFHLTRSWDNGDEFTMNGILGYWDSLEFIWQRIRLLLPGVSDNEFEDFKLGFFNNSDKPHLRRSISFETGPCAYLFKEIAQNLVKYGEHDYLSEPEIIRDIFDEIWKCFNTDLRPLYQRITIPTIVKFYYDEVEGEYYLGNALRYLFEEYINTGNELRSNTGKDFKGEIITSEQIEYVELL